ncbi:MAG: hypothetical protein KC912_12680 [Proteobacteria bacterium]|nr:hypothetical protein [Pseudomonadota bacterium]
MRPISTLLTLSFLCLPVVAGAAEVSVSDDELEDAVSAVVAGAEDPTVVLFADNLASTVARLYPHGWKLVDGRRNRVELNSGECVVRLERSWDAWKMIYGEGCQGTYPAPVAGTESPAAPVEAAIAQTDAPAVDADAPVDAAVAEMDGPAADVAVASAEEASGETAADASAAASTGDVAALPAGAPKPVALPVAAPAPVAPQAASVPRPVAPAVGTTPDVPTAADVRREPNAPGTGDSALIAFGTLYGGFAGAETGYLIGEALEESETGHTYEGPVAGAIGGAVAGSTVAYMLSRRRDYTRDEVALMYSGTALGGFYGAQLARTFIPLGDDGARERIHAATLAGTMAGVGISSLAAPKAADIGDQGRFALASAVGWQAGAGVAAMIPGLHTDLDLTGDGIPNARRKGRRTISAPIEMAGAAAFGGVAALANRTGIDAPKATTLGLSLGHGAWIGGWAPLLFSDNPDARQISGGLRLGAGLGYISAVGMSAIGQPSPRGVGFQTAGWAAGSALGAGIPLSLGKYEHRRGVVAPMLAGGVAGQVLGASVTPLYDEFDANDAALAAVLESWTAYQAVGWSMWANSSEGQPGSTKPIGYALSAAGAGSLVTLGMSPVLDVDPAGSMMLLSAGGWGSWGGAWGSQLAGADADEVWLSTLVAGNGTMVIAGAAQGIGWEPGWRDMGVINGTGLMGAAAGGLFGVIALYDKNDWDPLIASTLIGSGVGLGTGFVLAALPGKEPVVALPSLPTVPGSRTTGLKARVSAQPWMDDNGNPGAWVQVDVTEIAR